MYEFPNCRVHDVNERILQTIEDLLRGEISLIRLMNTSDICDLSSIVVKEQCTTVPCGVQESQGHVKMPTDGVPMIPPQIQNGDLAEADQSRLEVDEVDEEGAVGGIFSAVSCESVNGNTMNQVCLCITQGMEM